jgi:hypothetical protein
VFIWRYLNYPDSYPVAATPYTIFLFIGAEVTDITYAFVYAAVERKEKEKEKAKLK